MLSNTEHKDDMHDVQHCVLDATQPKRLTQKADYTYVIIEDKNKKTIYRRYTNVKQH
jgi:hypothetical protein